MGSCVICGADVDGHVCASHEEDVCFEFTGNRPNQLVPGRYYRGSVDGFADFGVFIDIGDSVTGLLHTSELDRRLESLDWDPGDDVYVQVKNVRDNGDVDLGWSIRQREVEFRGSLVQTPEGDELPADESAPEEPEPTTDDAGSPETAPTTDEPTAPETEEESPAPSPGGDDGGGAAAAAEPAPPETESTEAEAELTRTPIDALEDHVGDPVRIEGHVVEARQTSGPTIFEVRDETGTVDCAAFESAGVRAYPAVDPDDVVRIDGVVEERRGAVQVETESLVVLEGAERDAVAERLEEAIAERARPESVDLLADHPGVAAAREDVVAAATAIRRAVFEARPVVLRHSDTIDGYVAGAALERAVLPLIRAEHEESDAEYHYVDRRPLDGRLYGMRDAVRDTTDMLDARERHGEKVPLFVFVNAGSTAESRDGFELLGLYGAERVVIDGEHPDASMFDAAGAFVTPFRDEAHEDVSTTALAANVAAHVDPDAREDLRHLPAVSYWRGAPSAYADLAVEAGYDAERIDALREAIALEAFYQSYEAKRELIADLLFADRDLAAPASEQFRERVENEVRTAREHLDGVQAGGHAVATLDLAAFTHAYEFPPEDVLLAELAADADADAIIGVEEDELLVHAERPIDVRELGERVAEAVPEGGVETRGGRDGRLIFLAGERDAVLAAAVEAVADLLR